MLPLRALLTPAIIALLALALPPARAQTSPERGNVIAGRAGVIDGETLEIAGQRIRLAGVDAPADDHVCEATDDNRWRCGPRAVGALDEFLEEAIVSCVVRAHDPADRLTATCTTRGIDLGLWLIRNGLARAEPASANARYRQAESEARTARRGMWSVRAEP
jgi:endonuclease YncB( thermonuclease family)